MDEDNSMEVNIADEDGDEEEEDDEEDDEMSISEENPNQSERKVFLPGDPLKNGEVLTCDESAYVMLHQAQTGAPCLSFDIIQNPYNIVSDNFPMTAYIVAGTQAEARLSNSIIVMKVSNLHVTQESESDESDEDSSDDESDTANSKIPVMKCEILPHVGCVNRVRSVVHEEVVLAASWSEVGKVNIWDLSSKIKALDNPGKSDNISKPLYSFKGHQSEGYGLDWSSTNKGMLASGDCKSGLLIWYPSEDGTWKVDLRSLVGHTESVEDLQWSPNEPNVLASCSVDKSIRIWDIRASPTTANKLTVENAHEMDVNVLNWNRNEPFLVSGGDDGVIHIWDLRQLKSGCSVATFKHHTAPITTVEWHPDDASVFASGGADNQIGLWDIAVEKDSENSSDEIKGVPTQLLFIHQGQNDIKELHWHPKYPGVVISTAHSGFHIFKTISV